MSYWRLFYHIVWATKGRQPLLEATIESFVFRVIRDRCHELGGHVFAINGMPDHVHVVASVPPRIAPAEFVRVLKGSSSRYVSLEYDMPFEWQAGYGIFSLSERSLTRAIEYVTHQKEHHTADTLIPRLERIAEKDEGPLIQARQTPTGQRDG